MCVQLLLEGMFYINLLGSLVYNAVKMYWFCFCFFFCLNSISISESGLLWFHTIIFFLFLPFLLLLRQE